MVQLYHIQELSQNHVFITQAALNNTFTWKVCILFMVQCCLTSDLARDQYVNIQLSVCHSLDYNPILSLIRFSGVSNVTDIWDFKLTSKHSEYSAFVTTFSITLHQPMTLLSTYNSLIYWQNSVHKSADLTLGFTVCLVLNHYIISPLISLIYTHSPDNNRCKPR